MPTSVVLAALAIVFRLTRFFNADFLAEPIRQWVARRYGPESRAAYLIECPWCASIWIAVVVVPAAARWGSRRWFQALGLAAAASYLYGLAAQKLDDD